MLRQTGHPGPAFVIEYYDDDIDDILQEGRGYVPLILHLSKQCNGENGC
jgi:hypothetical protein